LRHKKGVSGNPKERLGSRRRRKNESPVIKRRVRLPLEVKRAASGNLTASKVTANAEKLRYSLLMNRLIIWKQNNNPKKPNQKKESPPTQAIPF
jgi:hypothetical protein